ncbi:MAG: hypothetical protein MJ147_06080 [Clostridia bacterium]|nr:hypothetical protein [Clostridia bacterium]
MAKENKADKKAAKAEAKAAKKAEKGEKNPEIVKSVISSVTAVACVAAMVVTSLSITDKICNTNKDIAEKASTGAGSAITSTDTGSADVAGSDDAGLTDDIGGADDTASADDTSVADDTSAPADDSSSSSSSSSTPSSSSSSSSSSASKADADAAPVGTDVAKVVAYYNKVANATKAYKGKITFKAKQGASTKITDTSFPKAAMNIANGMLPNDYPSDFNKNYVFTNGKAADGTSINKVLPIEGEGVMSKLSASGVASAKCAKSGNGYKIEIKLKPESTNSFSVQPPQHKACMNCLDMTDDDLKPFTCENCNIGYQGGTIMAVVNDKGLLTEFHAYNPMHITGTLKWTAISGTAVIDANWRRDAYMAY